MRQDPLQPDFSILDYSSTLRQGLMVEPVRVGKFLAVGPEARLPARCVRCNEPAAGEPVLLRLDLPTVFEWDAATILRLVAPTTVIHACYCQRHLARRAAARQVFHLLTGSAVVAALGAIVCRAVTCDLGLFLLAASCALLVIGALIARHVAARGLRLHHAQDGYAYLRVGRPFLAGFPEAPGASTTRRPKARAGGPLTTGHHPL